MSDAINVTPGTPVTPESGAPATPAAPAAPQAPAPTDWTTGLSDELRGYVQNKGFKDPASALDSYRNLEKLMGAPKERLLKLPEGDDPAAWKEVYERLGRPADPKEYQVAPPKGVDDPEYVNWARETFHELGLPKKQAEALAQKLAERAESQMSAKAEAYQTNVAQSEAQLKKEWGAAFEQNLNIAKNAARAFGMSPELIDKLEASMGFEGVMKFMHQVGSKVGEGSYVAGENRQSGFGVMTPEAAQQRIRDLRSDASFIQRYTAGGATEKQEMERLHRWAYPE